MSGMASVRGLHQLMTRLAPVTALRSNLTRSPSALVGPLQVCRRFVGTSEPQKSTTATAAGTGAECKTTTTTTTDEPPKPRKFWVSYGFSEEDQALDKHMMHLSLFITISIVFTLGGWGLAYLPDFRMKDWSQREAYLVLRERERLGLAPINVDLVDPARIKLPSDEELGDTEVII